MVYKFILISDEVDNFMREITIDASSTFLDFHKAILQSVGYKEEGMASFFMCNDYWEKEQEITLVEMDSSSEFDNFIMEDTTLEEFVQDEKQRLLYVFDYFMERAFFIELKEILLSKTQKAAVCSKSMGDAPSQFLDEMFDDSKITKPAKNNTSILDDENFYGDEDFDIEELDNESFSDVDFTDDIDAIK